MQATGELHNSFDTSDVPSITNKNYSEKNTQKRDDVTESMTICTEKIFQTPTQALGLREILTFSRSFPHTHVMDLLAVLSAMILICFLPQMLDPVEAIVQYVQLVSSYQTLMHMVIHIQLLGPQYKSRFTPILWFVCSLFMMGIVLHAMMLYYDLPWAWASKDILMSVEGMDQIHLRLKGTEGTEEILMKSKDWLRQSRLACKWKHPRTKDFQQILSDGKALQDLISEWRYPGSSVKN